MPYIVLDPAAAAAAPATTFGAPEAAGQHPMGKSLLALRVRLKLELGNRTDILDPTANEWINDAYLDFYSSLDLPESKRSYGFDMVVGQSMYLLPPTIDTVRDVFAADDGDTDRGAPMESIDVHSFRKFPAQDGEPQAYFREQNMLVFWPTPDAAYHVVADVIIKPAPLTADAHYPALEDKWHEALFKAAKYRGWEGIQNDTKALTTMNEMSRLVSRKNDRDTGDRANQYPAMRPIRTKADLMQLRGRTTNPEDEP